MKKIALLLTTAIFTCNVYGQLINPDFEIINDQGKATTWGPALIFAFPIDTICTGAGMDSMFFTTADAYLGNWAFELRNGQYCGTIYAGNVRPTKDDSDSFYSQSVPFHDRPVSCSFYYKFFPVQGDVARIQMQLDAGNGTPIADGYHTISGINGDWAKVTIPLTYYDNGNPDFLNMRFEIASDTQLHYGSRFLFDHVAFETPTTHIASISRGDRQVTCYPVPAKDNLYIRLGPAFKTGNVTISISDAMGRIIKTLPVAVRGNNNIAGIGITELSNGVYFLNVSADGFTANGKFVK